MKTTVIAAASALAGALAFGQGIGARLAAWNGGGVDGIPARVKKSPVD